MTSTVDAQRAPASPKVNFAFKTGASGFSYAYFQFFSLTTGQTFTINYSASTAPDAGNSIVETPGAINRYAGPGTYTLLYAGIGDNAGNFVYYSQAQVSTIFSSVNVTVTNNGLYDTTAPTVVSGEIRTPTISLSSGKPIFVADLTVADTISGVNQLFFALSDPKGGYFHTAFSGAPSPIIHPGVLPIGFDFNLNGGSSLPTGTWTISQIIVYDVAGNSLEISNASDIQKIFGVNTFQVTP